MGLLILAEFFLMKPVENLPVKGSLKVLLPCNVRFQT